MEIFRIINEVTFTMLDKDNVEKKYEVLFTFEDETGKTFLVYTDNSETESGDIVVHAAIYSAENPYELVPILDDADWDTVEAKIKEISSR